MGIHEQHPAVPFVLSNSRTFDLTSTEGRLYRIFVSAPKTPAPDKGWPVIYCVDGNAMFPQMVATANLLRMSDRVVLVGIGYPVETAFCPERRFFDLTPLTSPEVLLRSGRCDPETETGGNDKFLHVINSEVKAIIQAQYSIDVSNQSLFGHSLGGLFALHTLFSSRESFTNYVAAAPSLWWNEGSIVSDAHHLTQAFADSRRLLLLSNTDPQRREQDDVSKAHLAELIDCLTRVQLQVHHRVYEDETHISMVAPSVVAGLRFILGDTPRRS